MTETARQRILLRGHCEICRRRIVLFGVREPWTHVDQRRTGPTHTAVPVRFMPRQPELPDIPVVPF